MSYEDSEHKELIDALENAEDTLSMIQHKVQEASDELDTVSLLLSDEARKDELVQEELAKLMPTLKQFLSLAEDIDFSTDTL